MAFNFLVDRDTNDLIYQDGNVPLTTNKPQLLRQRLSDDFKTWRGEWFNKTDYGAIDREFLFEHGVTQAEIDAFFKLIVQSYDEVLAIESWDSKLNPLTREYDLTYVVRTDYGTVSSFVSTARPDQEIDYTQVLPPSTDLPCNVVVIPPGDPCPIPDEPNLDAVYLASGWDYRRTGGSTINDTISITTSSCTPTYILYDPTWDGAFGYSLTAQVTSGGDAVLVRLNDSNSGTAGGFPPILDDQHFDSETISSGQTLDMTLTTMLPTQWVMVAVLAAESGTETNVDVIISTTPA